MNLKDTIEHMFYSENLTVKEIASALKIDPTYVYKIVYHK